MRIVVIGGTGHVGTYLVPRFVEAGHQVVCISRGQREPYQPHYAWQDVERIQIDRDAAEQDRTFGPQIQELCPDAVIDMICFTRESAKHLVSALRGKVQYLLMCGTIWIHGRSIEVPTTEAQNRRAFGDYGIKKEKLTAYLLKEARMNQFPVTVLHPGHIVGPGWVPITPLGNFNPQVFTKLAQGYEVAFPTLGMETVHHVHADDVAQAFECALDNWSAAVGEDFHVVSDAAVSLKGYAETVASWFGKEAKLKFLGGEEWSADFSEDDIQKSWDHILRSPNCSIAKAKQKLGYQPRYTSFQAVYEAVQWLIAQGIVSP
ncbi:NAD-dependent epimerase/dehydratase family protein [candidate division KSB3 bacterium]|uniref:NAD-dependent epimerase/dehydratase family protein n=1 Tax=candidate division KSB3 bacterium TaxID=2044937 RepID=A0A9D5Q694_9BACT|nr:NAD-dependent epimerase/dehydratase family protein [candidate division KSB3 bacterium]MBD3325485.1 NAD-dependent epimerase/dehydratase family protein [candidate division KSB3 bacterium]